MTTTDSTEGDETEGVPETSDTEAEGVSGIPDTVSSMEDTETDETTFSRTYVQQLRQEAAEHRTKARDRDALARRLHERLTASLGRLADPSDLPYDEGHLSDPEALAQAVEELLERKPHLASRRVAGDVGQGATGGGGDVDLAGLLRARA